MAHIIWTKEEKHKIALAAWLTRQIHPARNLTRIVRDSMEEQIVSSRHRDIRQSQSYMSWLMPLWKIFDAGLAAENQGLSTFHLDPDNPESALLPVSAARVDAAPSEKYQAIKPMVVPEVERQALAQAHTHSQSQCSAAHCMETFSLDELLAEVTVRIKDLSSPEQLRTLIRSEVNDVLNRRLPGVLAPDVPEEPRTDFEDPVSRTRLPKVCVIGLLPSQQELFRHQCAGPTFS